MSSSQQGKSSLRLDSAGLRSTGRSSSQSSPDVQRWSVDDPLAGFVVVVGLIVAIAVLPADVEPRAALRLPTGLFVLSLCLLPVLAAFRDPKSVLRAEHVLIMSPVYWLLLDPLQGRADLVGVNREDVELAFVAIALFVTGAWLACMQRPWRAPEFVRATTHIALPTQFYFGIGTLAFTLAFLKYAIPSGFDLIAMAQALGGGRTEGAWQRGDIGGSEAFLDHLSYFGYLLPPLTVVMARLVRRGDPRPWILGLGTLVLSLFLVQGGGRRLVGMYFGAGAVVWFLSARRLRVSTLLGMGLLVIGMLFVFEQMLVYRNTGVMALFDDGAYRSTPDDGALIRVDDNFYRLAQTTAIFPTLHDYTTWRYLLWVAVRPVPRYFWADKPLDPGFNLAAFNGLTGVSLSSSVVGELFMAGGLAAVAFGGWLYGRIARSLSHFLSEATTPSALLIYGVGLFAILVGVRSMIDFVLASYVVLAWVVLVRVYAGFRPS